MKDIPEQLRLLRYLRARLPQPWKDLCIHNSLKTQYAQIACLFVADDTIDKSLFSKTWSCKDLQHSVYLGPNQVRACCKRFFVDGERRGDVVLIEEAGPGTGSCQVNALDIKLAKQDLIDRMNTGEETPCSGCPFAEFKAWPAVTEQVKYLSLEHHSVCNLRCTYCSPTYYEGRRPGYDIQGLVSELAPGVETVVWGGGEPTLCPEFAPLTKLFAEAGAKQRVLSNSVIYNDHVRALLAAKSIELVTSVDAGTPELFKKIRGADKFNSVLFNLSCYAEDNPDFVTVKYILTEENCSSFELNQFVKEVQSYGLERCNFQISCDFRQEEATVDELRAVAELHALLLGAGAECVFVDDLCRIRIVPAVNEAARLSRLPLRPLEPPVVNTLLGIPIAAAENYRHVIVWGSGEQAERLFKDTLFFKHVRRTVYDSDTYDTGTDSGRPIVIAASQSYPAIYRELKQRGLAHRVIKELIL